MVVTLTTAVLPLLTRVLHAPPTGTKLGVRQAGAFAGIVSGDPLFIPQVSELARALGVPAALAQGLVGVATGSEAYLDVGADVLANKLGLGSAGTLKALALIVRGNVNQRAIHGVTSRLGVAHVAADIIVGSGTVEGAPHSPCAFVVSVLTLTHSPTD